MRRHKEHTNVLAVIVCTEQPNKKILKDKKMLVDEKIVNSWYTDKTNFVAIYFNFFWTKILRRKMTTGFSVCPMFWMAVLGFLLEKPYLIIRGIFRFLKIDPRSSITAAKWFYSSISSIKISEKTYMTIALSVGFLLITCVFGLAGGEIIMNGLLLSIPLSIAIYLWLRVLESHTFNDKYFWEWDTISIFGAICLLALFNIPAIFTSIVAVIGAIITSIGWLISTAFGSALFLFKFAVNSLPFLAIMATTTIAFMAIIHFLNKAGILDEVGISKTKETKNINNILRSFIGSYSSCSSVKNIDDLRTKQKKKEIYFIATKKLYNKYAKYLKNIETCKDDREILMGRLTTQDAIYNLYLSDYIGQDEFKATMIEINDDLYDSLVDEDARLRKADARAKRRREIWEAFWASIWTNAKAKKEKACPYKTFNFEDPKLSSAKGARSIATKAQTGKE